MNPILNQLTAAVAIVLLVITLVAHHAGIVNGGEAVFCVLVAIAGFVASFFFE